MFLLLTQFSQYLHENAAYVRPLEDSFLQLYQSITEDTVTVLVRFGWRVWRSYVCLETENKLTLIVIFCFEWKETVVKLKIFSDNFSSYTHFLQKILPYQLKRSAVCVCVCTRVWARDK